MSEKMLVGYFVLALVGTVLGCQLIAPEMTAKKNSGDGSFRITVSGRKDQYAPGKRYIVSLYGPNKRGSLQNFTRFKVVLDPPDSTIPRSPTKQGQIQLYTDNYTRFDDTCFSTVVPRDNRTKTNIQFIWVAPEAGSGCVVFKAMVYQNEFKWFAEEGQLTKRICEDTTLSIPDCCACDEAKYKMVFEGLWSPKTHPKDFPVQAMWLTHFSDVIGATHPSNFSFWGEGLIASDGFRSLAEWGSVGLLERELRQQGRLLRSIVKAQGLWYPKVNSNTTAVFSVDRSRHRVSLASMFGPSPDWVVGVSGLDLCTKDCSWLESKIVDLYPYDAGTDDGISYMSPNAETTPREKMYRITPMYPEDPRAPFYEFMGTKMNPLARLYLTREKLIPRSCDEKTLQALITDDSENTQTVDKPECAVEEWGPWSPCSVTCGKGLRMRSRVYRLPQKATMFQCDRQLISKEMCVSDVPECPASETEKESEEVTAPPTEDLGGICKTTEWGPWSECSVTCGIGISTRRRTFINHMGLKKCPLVSIEENRKCMEPQCLEQDNAVSDPGCPTTEWTGWSACSATCGRGVRFRTRLLLVSADMQRDCSSKVELLQQRPCTERDDCTFDMLTAKRVCMEAPDQGPCRGLYQRWAFVAIKGMCIQFSYGGCRGNQNNFLTEEECLDGCKILRGIGQQNQKASNNSSEVNTDASLTVNADSLVRPCNVTDWSGWSRCNVTCGMGYQERIRTVLEPPRNGGTPCPTRLSFRRRCIRYCN